MSVILDALKKLDREKSSRRNGTVNIAVEILKPDLTRPGKRILLYFAAVSLAAAAITYAVVVEFGFHPKPLPPASVSPPVQSQQVVPAAPSREPVRAVQDKVSRVPTETQLTGESQTPAKSEVPAKSLPAAKREIPAESQPAVKSETPTGIEIPEESKIPAEGHPTAKSESLAPSLERKEVIETDVAPRTTKKSAEHRSRESAAAPPSLRVSGIVWKEEHSERLAVINGMILREGSEIGGVKVEEIHPTRVRFSHKDRPFEISLGSSLVITE